MKRTKLLLGRRVLSIQLATATASHSTRARRRGDSCDKYGGTRAAGRHQTRRRS